MASDDIVRVATPRRPIPNEGPEVSRLSAMAMALLGELAITRERLDTVERLLKAASVLRRSEIEAYDPTSQAAAEREQVRKRQIGKVMRPLEVDIERTVANVQQKVANADAVLEEEVKK